jgi:hypothetical protein
MIDREEIMDSVYNIYKTMKYRISNVYKEMSNMYKDMGDIVYEMYKGTNKEITVEKGDLFIFKNELLSEKDFKEMIER